MKAKVVRVGFDLDGVILYNPARNARPFISFAKKLFRQDLGKFHYPRSKPQRLLWTFLHKSSVWISPGVKKIKQMVKEGKIEAYIVTARYEFLKGDFQRWLNRI